MCPHMGSLSLSLSLSLSQTLSSLFQSMCPHMGSLSLYLSLSKHRSTTFEVDPSPSTVPPPPRSPLISIPNPSQNPREGPSSEPRFFVDHPAKTPRSAQSTPGQGGSRVFGANWGLGSGFGGRERGCFMSPSRGFGEAKSTAPFVEVPNFELNEDPFFWKDRNVQFYRIHINIQSPEGVSSSHGVLLRFSDFLKLFSAFVGCFSTCYC